MFLICFIGKTYIDKIRKRPAVIVGKKTQHPKAKKVKQIQDKMDHIIFVFGGIVNISVLGRGDVCSLYEEFSFSL